MPKLADSFYQGDDVVSIARKLLGKVLVTDLDGCVTSGLITETEAYHQSEKACHAYNGRKTPRTEILFQSGGNSYVYLCYGIHHLFNVTTCREGEAAAVLIRAVQPLDGLSCMLGRRGMQQNNPRLTAGPGVLTQAMGISVKFSGAPLNKYSGVWIEEMTGPAPQHEIVADTRIGVAYAEEDALLPWRFYLKNNKWVSKK